MDDGAESRFETLVRQNEGAVTAFLRSIIWDRVAVEDLFQETILAAWRRMPDYDAARPFGPWLRGIASNVAMTYCRKHKRRALVCSEAVLEHLESQIRHIDGRPGDNWDDKVADLHDCIADLGEAHRQVIQLRYFDARPAGEIAEQLDVSREVIKKRIQRARHRLFECLRDKGVLKDGRS